MTRSREEFHNYMHFVDASKNEIEDRSKFTIQPHLDESELTKVSIGEQNGWADKNITDQSVDDHFQHDSTLMRKNLRQGYYSSLGGYE